LCGQSSVWWVVGVADAEVGLTWGGGEGGHILGQQ